MKTNLLKAFSAVALASTLVACGKTKTVKEEWTDEDKMAWAEENGLAPEMTDEEKAAWAEENGYAKKEDSKAKLEVTFNNYEDATDNLTAIKWDDLETKFAQKYSFLLMFGNSTCSTCSTLKDYMGEWVAETKYSVYYVSDLTTGTATEKTKVMERLSNPTTWPKLFAVVDGEIVDVLGFTGSEQVTDANVKGFIGKTFEMETFKAETKRFEDMSEFRETVASGEQFIVYVGRDACPDCQNLSDIKKDDSLRKYFTEYEGKIYSIVSEDTIAELGSSETWKDVTKWNGYWGSIDATKTEPTKKDIENGKTTLVAAQSSVSDYNKAENLAYMIAGGVFDAETLALGNDAFLAAALEYANHAYLHDDGTYYMRDSIRSVPGLAAVNFNHDVEYAKEGDAIFGLISTYAGAALGTKTVDEVTYKTITTAKTIQVYDETANKFVNQNVEYIRFVPKNLSLGGSAGVPNKDGVITAPFTGTNPVALWITHKNAFVGALGGKGAANFGTYTNNLTFSNIYTDCLTSRNATYHTEYELDMVQAQTMNWMTSWVYTTAE